MHRDPHKADINRLARDIHTLRAILKRKSKLRGKQKGAFVSEINEYFEWLSILERILRERLGMANKSQTQNTWKGFIECKMTDLEKQNFAEWDVHDNDLFLLLSEAVSAGHKLSMTFNKQNDQFVCSFTGNDGTGKHEGFTLSGYAGDWYISLRVLLYKHCVLLESDWTLAKDRPTEGIG